MKKHLPVICSALLFLALPLGAALGQAGIQGSSHDFTGTGADTVNYKFAASLCETCHVPHNPASGSSGPLWNHAVTAATYTLYTSATLNATMAQPGGVSKLCLSCHDGTVAVNSYGGVTGTKLIPNTDPHYIGVDLSNDHPVSFTYDAALATLDGGLVTPSGGKVGTGNLPLYTNKLECATCHNPHGAGVSMVKFLRYDAATICTQCHTK